jgi:hypothetical protein
MTRLAALALVAATVAAAPAAAPAPASSGTHAVRIYLPRGSGRDCARVVPVKRLVAAPALLRGAMQALLRGPTKAERARGYDGWFSAKTAGALRSVRIARRVAFVDFRSFARTIPNASTSCGSALLLAQLDRTATQFPSVDRAVYSFDGSRRSFYEWLQREAPR